MTPDGAATIVHNMLWTCPRHGIYFARWVDAILHRARFANPCVIYKKVGVV